MTPSYCILACAAVFITEFHLQLMCQKQIIEYPIYQKAYVPLGRRARAYFWMLRPLKGAMQQAQLIPFPI